jgi:hypothetical protein
LHQSYRISSQEEKVKRQFQENYHKRKSTNDIFSGLDHIDEKISQCIKLAEDTLNAKGPNDQEYPKFVNPWASNNSEFEQDQEFINYLDELNGPISEDELAEWSDDINLFI